MERRGGMVVEGWQCVLLLLLLGGLGRRPAGQQELST